MGEARFMLMVKVTDDPTGYVRGFAAAHLPGRGRRFTRQEVEMIAAQTQHEDRFLLPYTEQTEQFGPDEGPAPTLAVLEGETVWNYGEPTYVDLLAVVRLTAFSPSFESAEAPFPDLMPVSVSGVVEQALDRFGVAERHDVETAFDELMFEIGGKRHGEPPYYHVPFAVLGISDGE